MKTIEALQREIDTTADLQTIVRTMKVLAAVSIRQYERAQESLQHYNRNIEMGLQIVLQQSATTIAKVQKKSQSSLGTIIFGSDHGLCGRYNENIVNFTLRELDKKNQSRKPRRILVVGTRLEASLHERGQTIEECFQVPGTVAGITDTVQKLLLKINNWQLEGIEKIILCHHTRQLRTNYSPIVRQLLPVEPGKLNHKQAKLWPPRSLPQFSLPSEELLSSLIRQHLFIKLYNACAESLAGEHASRLISMQVAEKNSQEQLENLTALYRQQRQNKITEELLDIVSGFETLKSS